jgi:hypothetical protein
MEQEVVMAMVTRAHSTIIISDQRRADFEKSKRLAQYPPLPDDNNDDFADEPYQGIMSRSQPPYLTGLGQKCGFRRQIANVTVITVLFFHY